MFGRPARAHYLDTFAPRIARSLLRAGLHVKAIQPDGNGGLVGVWCRSGWRGWLANMRCQMVVCGGISLVGRVGPRFVSADTSVRRC